MKHRYFDYAAATPMSDKVMAAMQPYQQTQFYNPSALYGPARTVRAGIEQARQSIAAELGVNSGGVYFTAGVTEANNLLLQGLAKQHPGSQMIVSAIEHESVIEPARMLEEQGLIDLKVAPVDDQGRVEVEQLLELITDQTLLISLIMVNNETGVIQDTAVLATKLDQLRQQRLTAGNQLPLILHSDAAQVPTTIDLKLSRYGLDVVSVSAAKLYGPKQSAALVWAQPQALSPLISGGTQERGVRAGTENVANIIGLATALSETAAEREQQRQQLAELRDDFEQRLSERYGQQLVVHSQGAKRAPHLSSVVIPGVKDGERLVMELDQLGFMVATGSACTAGSGQPSAIILALGEPVEAAAATLRVSFGRQTTEQDVEQLVEAIDQVVAAGLV